MQSIFDITTDNLIKGINFISKVCAAELGEINILPTDRIISSAMNKDTEFFWDRALNTEQYRPSIEYLKAGYKRVYRTILRNENVQYNDDTDFRIYVSNIEGDTRVSVLNEIKITKDQTSNINIIIPNLYYVKGNENIDKDQCLFIIIKNIFAFFLKANRNSYECGNRGLSVLNIFNVSKKMNKFINDFASVFAILTGLFPDDFAPNKMSRKLLTLSEIMFKNEKLMSKAKDGYMIINNTKDYLFIDYMNMILAKSEND